VSGLDQPIIIANSNYHVGQERSWRAAEEQGFVKEEGLDRYVYERGGLIPGQWEFDGLGRQMWELLPTNGREANRLMSEGYPLVLDLAEFYQGLGGWPPGKVIVATKQTIEHRGGELRAFLRASLRGFWFTQDPRNHRYMYDLETRLRETTFNEYERKIRMLSSPTPPPPREGPNTMGSMVIDGLVPRPLLARLVEDMVKFDELQHAIDVDDVLKDAASQEAYQHLFDRGLIDLPVLEQWRDATYGSSWRNWWERLGG